MEPQERGNRRRDTNTTRRHIRTRQVTKVGGGGGTRMPATSEAFCFSERCTDFNKLELHEYDPYL